LEPRKGVDILVKAMARVWGRYPEAKLVMAGQDWNSHEGPMSEVLRRLAGDHADRLVLLGKLPTHQVFPALARADVVALPSRWENLAVASLEALALGRPLVLTRAGGFPEIVTDGVDGLLVPPEDVDALADALLRVLTDADLRRRLGQAAARRAQRYSIERVTDEHLAFFERVVARS
jgi:glycosyltransferase involved in cell wall biosynthesis